MRLLLTAMNCPKGELEYNQRRHHELLRQGADAGCDLVLLPEMSLTGYRPSAAIALDDPAVTSIVESTTHGPAVCFGLVERSSTTRPFITQLVAVAGERILVHRKAYLGADEEADFQSGGGSAAFELAGTLISIAVCAEIGSDAPYQRGSTVVLGPSAPGLYGQRRSSEEDWRRGFDWWREQTTSDARRLLRPDQLLALSTQSGVTDDEDFPGWAALIDSAGEVRCSLPDWQEGTLLVEC